MTFVNETNQADFRTVFLTNTVITANDNTTFFGSLGPGQGEIAVSAAASIDLGLDTTTVRSDIYALEVDSVGTIHMEVAINGTLGGDLPDIGIVVAGDNGTTVVGAPLDQSGWSVLATSDSNTGPLFQQSFATAGHDFLYVILSGDSIDSGNYSFSAADSLAAVGDDIVTGTENADELLGLRGDDTIDGLGGIDAAEYLQNQEVYTLRLGSTIQIEDRSGTEGLDTLRNIETLEFSNGEFALSSFDDVANLTAEEFSSFTEMYIAYFNRAPDAAGLMFWANAFATGTSLAEIAGFFADSPEAQALFPSDSPSAAFVEAIYTNVLGRASDPAGAEFWTGVLEAGSVSRSEFVLEVLRGARAETPADATAEFIAQQAADVAFLDNKIDVGIYFSAILGMSNVANAQSVMALYDGSTASSLAAKNAADEDFALAQAPDGTGEFLIQLVGVVDDPFAIA